MKIRHVELYQNALLMKYALKKKTKIINLKKKKMMIMTFNNFQKNKIKSFKNNLKIM